MRRRCRTSASPPGASAPHGEPAAGSTSGPGRRAGARPRAGLIVRPRVVQFGGQPSSRDRKTPRNPDLLTHADAGLGEIENPGRLPQPLDLRRKSRERLGRHVQGGYARSMHRWGGIEGRHALRQRSSPTSPEVPPIRGAGAASRLDPGPFRGSPPPAAGRDRDDGVEPRRQLEIQPAPARNRSVRTGAQSSGQSGVHGTGLGGDAPGDPWPGQAPSAPANRA